MISSGWFRSLRRKIETGQLIGANLAKAGVDAAGLFVLRILAVPGVMPSLTDVLIPLALTLGVLWVAALALAVSAQFTNQLPPEFFLEPSPLSTAYFESGGE